MQSTERLMQRNIANRYVFYKSLNVITPHHFIWTNLTFECNLIFHFLQFKFHLNLKTDEENEFFYEKCQDYLINNETSFYSHLKKCNNNIIFEPRVIEKHVYLHQNGVLKVLLNLVYLLTMGSLLVYLGHVFLLILIHLFLNE